MTSAEAKLKERVKELTCLYEVTSIIVNADYDQIDAAPEAIESTKDVHLAHKLVSEYVQKSDYDAYVIACFCDQVSKNCGHSVIKMFLGSRKVPCTLRPIVAGSLV